MTTYSASNIARTASNIATGALLALFMLCIVWEWWVAPLRDGGSWLILKALPLAILLFHLWRRPETRRYTYQWCTLLIWFYFTEGVVRAWSDLDTTSQYLAMTEVALCVTFLVAAIIYIRATPSHLARSMVTTTST
jgi:uncharacterized membrane protein